MDGQANESLLRLVRDIGELERTTRDGTNVGTLFMIDGEAWTWESVGCVPCVDEGESVSFQCHSDENRFLCMRCGPLVEIPYSMSKFYTITIGPVERTGEESVRDSMLFPESLNGKETAEIISELLDEAEEEEREQGLFGEQDD